MTDCIICGKQIDRANKKYCSMKCERISIYKRMVAKRGTEPTIYTCEICTQRFSSFRKDCKTCSSLCRTKRNKRIGEKNQLAYWLKISAGEKLKNNPYLKLRFEILKRDGFQCSYCGRGRKENVILHVDHILAKNNGGDNSPENLTTACQECNLGKSDVLLSERLARKAV